VKTFQADLSDGVRILFAQQELFSSVVWSSVRRLALSFSEPDFTFASGFELAAKHFPDMQDLNEERDQFIIRFVEGELKEELVVRLNGGYPTTDREADEFEALAKANAAKREAFVRKLIEDTIKSKKEATAKEKRQENVVVGRPGRMQIGTSNEASRVTRKKRVEIGL